MIRYFVAGALSMAAAITPATAKHVEFNFNAEIAGGSPGFDVGTPISGSFAYDDALTPDNLPPAMGGTLAEFEDSSIRFTITVNGIEYSSGANAVLGDNTIFDGDFLGLWSSGPPIFGLYVTGGATDWFDVIALPIAFPILAQEEIEEEEGDSDDPYGPPRGGITFFNQATGGFEAIVLNIIPVVETPEPAALGLLGLGLAGLVAARRRKAASSDLGSALGR